MSPIKYYLQPNPVTPDPDDHSARIQPVRNFDQANIIEEMMKRGSSLTRSDILSCLTLHDEVVSDEVADGSFVNLPLANFKPSVGGVFKDAADTYDSSRHVKKATISAGPLLNQKIQQAKVEKITQPKAEPALVQFEDVVSHTMDSKATPGGIGIIVGEELKFDPENEREGIFFVDSENNEHKATVIAKRTEGTLMFSIPAELTNGEYTLYVRKGYKQGNEIREGSLSDVLNVE